MLFFNGLITGTPRRDSAVWNGGIAIYGGLLAGALVLYPFSRSRRLIRLISQDIAAPRHDCSKVLAVGAILATSIASEPLLRI